MLCIQKCLELITIAFCLHGDGENQLITLGLARATRLASGLTLRRKSILPKLSLIMTDHHIARPDSDALLRVDFLHPLLL